jgi:geranylgeranyl transferase type-2 subunit beta
MFNDFLQLIWLSFGGSVGHDPHLLYTLSALQILALCDGLHLISDRSIIAKYIGSLQQADGSFAGDQWGEIDTRFSYCALSALSILGELTNGHVNIPQAVDFIGRCLPTVSRSFS